MESSDILRKLQKFGPFSTYNAIILSEQPEKKEWKMSQTFAGFSEYLNLKYVVKKGQNYVHVVIDEWPLVIIY